MACSPWVSRIAVSGWLTSFPLSSKSPSETYFSRSSRSRTVPGKGREQDATNKTRIQKGQEIVRTESTPPICPVDPRAGESRHQYGGGRVFCTTLGSINETVADDRYLDLVARGILWAVDQIEANGSPKAGFATSAAR
jgi:hypothetical protein